MPATAITPRKWTAKVIVEGEDFSELLDYGPEPGDFFPKVADTLREVERAAIRIAANLIREGYAEEGRVVVFKQLKNDPEPKRDRSHFVYADGDDVRSQYMGR